MGWTKRWRFKAWKNKHGKRLSWDLWERLLDVSEGHDVEFFWLRAHAGDPENERSDFLSVQAAQREILPADVVYEQWQAEPEQAALPSLFDYMMGNPTMTSNRP